MKIISKTSLFFILIFSFISLNSCYTSANYFLKDHSIQHPIGEKIEGKILLIKNNTSSYESDFDEKINTDFRRLFGDKLVLNFKNDFFDNYIFLQTIDITLLKNIKIANPDLNYIIFLRFLSTDTNITKPKTIQIIDYKNMKYYREYHLIFDLYNLDTQKKIYSNEAVSILEKVDDSSMYPSEMSQLKQTYAKIFSNFKKQVK